MGFLATDGAVDEVRSFIHVGYFSMRAVNHAATKCPKNQTAHASCGTIGGDQIAGEIQSPRLRLNGRRFGKTTLGVDRLVHPALQGQPVAWFAPTHKMLTEVWRDMSIALKPVTARVSAQEHRLELITGGVVDMWSLDAFDSVRGRKYARVVLDEAAMVAGLKHAWEEAIRPTLTDFKGDAYFLSTPKGVNFFHEAWARGADRFQTEWASWQLPTTANPFIDPSEVEQARLELPELTFKQEYLAEFLQSEGAVFRNIEANMTAPAATPQQHKGHRIVAGVDWAQKHDFTAISVLCATCRQELELDRFNQIAWDFQRGRLQVVCEKWGVADILAEENSIGSPNILELQKLHLPVRPFQTTASSKPPLIQSLALALEKQEIAWLSVPVATAELAAYESKVNANTGRISYGAPEGGHDDTVIARALALAVIKAPSRKLVSG